MSTNEKLLTYKNDFGSETRLKLFGTGLDVISSQKFETESSFEIYGINSGLVCIFETKFQSIPAKKGCNNIFVPMLPSLLVGSFSNKAEINETETGSIFCGNLTGDSFILLNKILLFQQLSDMKECLKPNNQYRKFGFHSLSFLVLNIQMFHIKICNPFLDQLA